MAITYSGDHFRNSWWYTEVLALVDTCNRIRKKQLVEGSIHEDDQSSKDVRLLIEKLHTVKRLFDGRYIQALISDLENWMEVGLHTVPRFDNSYSQFSPVENHNLGLLLFPIYDLSYREKSVKLEVCLYYRNEPQNVTESREKYPYAIFQGCELLMATGGLTSRNVFTLFPENIAVTTIDDQRKFAFFFITNYLKVFQRITKPLGQFLISNDFDIFQASEDELYDARCAFSFVHDHNHYVGALPFDSFYDYKTTLLGSFFEEMRVEAITFNHLRSSSDRFFLMAAELILAERTYRYTYTNEPWESFDTLTNYFFLNYFLQNGAVEIQQMKLYYDLSAIEKCMNVIAEDSHRLELSLLGSSGKTFEKRIIEWAKAYLPFDHKGRKVERSLFADWFKNQGEALGIPKTMTN